MKKLLSAIVALFLGFAATAQDRQPTVQVNISGPVVFDQLLLPGASAKSLEAYSAYAADKKAVFSFSEAAIGKMKQCNYMVTCEKGKITSIHVGVRDAASCKELKAFAATHLGQPKSENVQKVDGTEQLVQSSYIIDGRKANLTISVDNTAYLTMK